MENKDFCVFILTHGRPDNVHTKKTLDKYNYTGKVYFVVDNEDKTYDKYVENFGKENVLLFDKKEMADSIDECNNFDNRKVIVHARNVCFKLAKELGIKYFVQFDDDYTVFRYRWIDKYMTKGYVQNLDRLFDNILQYFIDTPFHTVCLAQGGDFIGGESCGLLTNYLKNGRKAMNSFFCSTDRYFQFVGQINEDVNTYTHLASKGLLMMTLPFVGLEQKQTQSNKGGMTDAYIKFGTYVKSFTTVLLQPSSVSVKMLTTSNARLHHHVNWGNTVPLIIDSKHKKC